VVRAEVGTAGGADFGLALLLYAVGIQYGREVFTGLTSASGLKANLVALVGVLVAGAGTLLLVKAAGLKAGYALGRRWQLELTDGNRPAPPHNCQF
jgi:uncharacterized transporter YbjL